MKLFPFQKGQRLTLKKDIETLFRSGKAFSTGPLRVIYLINASDTPQLKILITASRKKFRNAADRNRIKRLIRESYRLNRARWLPDSLINDLSIHVAFIFTGDSANIPYSQVDSELNESLIKLAHEINAARIRG